MSIDTMIGVDLAKSVFQVHGASMRRIWVIGNTPFYFGERGCRELPGFWENSRHRVDRRHRGGGTGGGPGASSEAVDEYQFGVVERLDLDRADIAERDAIARVGLLAVDADARSEEHTSELQSLMRISYAVFCLKKK